MIIGGLGGSASLVTRGAGAIDAVPICATPITIVAHKDRFWFFWLSLCLRSSSFTDLSYSIPDAIDCDGDGQRLAGRGWDG